MTGSAHAGLRIRQSYCQVQTRSPTVALSRAEGDRATVGGLERQLAFSIVLEEKKRVTPSPAGPTWGLMSWDLVASFTSDLSLLHGKAKHRLVKYKVCSPLVWSHFSLTVKNWIVACNLATSTSVLSFQSFFFFCFCF